MKCCSFHVGVLTCVWGNFSKKIPDDSFVAKFADCVYHYLREVYAEAEHKEELSTEY